MLSKQGGKNMMSRMFRRVPMIYQNRYNRIKDILQYKKRDAFDSISGNNGIEEPNRKLHIDSLRDSIQLINFREVN